MSESTNSEPQIDIDHLVGIALADPDDEGDCLRCACTMARPDRSEGEEATPLCHWCAQAVLPMLASEVRRLHKRDTDRDAKVLRMLADAGDPVACAFVNAPVVDGSPDADEPRIGDVPPEGWIPHEVVLHELLERAKAEHDALVAEIERLRRRDDAWQAATRCSDPDLAWRAR